MRKLLSSVSPRGKHGLLQIVGSIECDALLASGDELRMVIQRLSWFRGWLFERGVITAERWKQFFGELETPKKGAESPVQALL